MSKSPQLTLTDIQGRADAFRDGLGHEFSHPPFDVIYIADIVLRIDFIPLDGLFKDLGIDAALTWDLRGLYVDKDTFAKYDQHTKTEPWIEKRFNFSVAHEIGHKELHAEFIQGVKFKSEEEYLKWVKTSRTGIEFQADEFAGRFLVPRAILIEEYDRIQKNISSQYSDWRQRPGTRTLVAKKLAPRFGVNHEVIEKRLDRENIWRAE